ncbi:PIN2/TERF1-interacting telomerase inhibitor 1-like, partial [Brachionichthys hirsutus]|uniref:PIN2/TERF1-interacting telomerase inhibitor 1-like n=1 Tax=Brachionichthys hirsutus TaxID=412623 RepID=UPI0036047D46
ESNGCGSRSSDTEETATPSVLDAESITKTVKSALTMQEYFSQRMSRLKKACGKARSSAPTAEAEANETGRPSEEPSPSHSHSHIDSQELKKKKKKKKSKKATEEPEANTSGPNIRADDGDQQQEHLGKKKKKRKTVESEGATAENGSSGTSEELPPPRKQKKRKEHKETERLNTRGPTDQVVDSEIVHKKKKPWEEVDNVVKGDGAEVLKQCKKKKRHQL